MPIFIADARNNVRAAARIAVRRWPRPRRTSLVLPQSFEEARALNRLAHDDALGERDTGKRTELGVAAFNQLAERGRIQSCGDVLVAGSGKLALIARERRPLGGVMRRDVDDKRGGCAVVDEVMA